MTQNRWLDGRVLAYRFLGVEDMMNELSDMYNLQTDAQLRGLSPHFDSHGPAVPSTPSTEKKEDRTERKSWWRRLMGG